MNFFRTTDTTDTKPGFKQSAFEATGTPVAALASHQAPKPLFLDLARFSKETTKQTAEMMKL